MRRAWSVPTTGSMFRPGSFPIAGTAPKSPSRSTRENDAGRAAAVWVPDGPKPRRLLLTLNSPWQADPSSAPKVYARFLPLRDFCYRENWPGGPKSYPWPSKTPPGGARREFGALRPLHGSGSWPPSFMPQRPTTPGGLAPYPSSKPLPNLPPPGGRGRCSEPH